MTDRARDGAFDDWLDALATGDPYYLGCENGHGWLPPRRVCPDCGSRELSRETLPDAGTIATHTAVHVATPQFEDDAPYVTAIADFGPVSITGLVRGVEPDAVEIGTTVGIEIGERETTGEQAVVFRPR
ncbi:MULTISPECIES: Zn-ribbon domain-containing OB-fold protein [Halomicrobium]|uniref:ChsH2 C-terminal OB-fold domain-containing protein n=2 Tax=Halomicrobium mukohataei TaxID=57705 RepID=C7P0C1_HALMD|nr:MULTISPECIES: OB-fold domain-containing protein [Halomicrobium]ACV48913.1 protein of unknown function DUF35 [Halomicrobium mukohataei DSM 12286]QCD64340.1 nucleic acid-binding protein [Halomicrobium mukohataei]QFR19146.1 nucleic acid-binding protein [Halomicrobium sp. ZPS1]